MMLKGASIFKKFDIAKTPILYIHGDDHIVEPVISEKRFKK